MPWDQALLRKFSCTSHYRLLNQVRSELKAQPLERDKNSSDLSIKAKPLKGESARTIKRPNAVEDLVVNGSLNEKNYESEQSFKDRLNAIDMR